MLRKVGIPTSFSRSLAFAGIFLAVAFSLSACSKVEESSNAASAVGKAAQTVEEAAKNAASAANTAADAATGAINTINESKVLPTEAKQFLNAQTEAIEKARAAANAVSKGAETVSKELEEKPSSGPYP